ncbi:TIM barrel protein [Mariniblastus fucicola]|uniref:Inosose isomerase n=1 Tax=Mariniblastus fucicola TaxID=980251 RepID=A0A5B9PBX1_9BACT|nr:TIM barrel protein [Mariniblastus fucicola]QEG23764.1 Inosose isomerase [Mariniblastus fucicola]
MTHRRTFLKAAAAGSALTVLASGKIVNASQTSAPKRKGKSAIRYCLNMSTVRGHELSVPDQVKLAADAGYDAIEPWIGDLKKFVDSGGSLVELKQQIDDSGLTVESAIGFAQWIVDDDAARATALDAARADMEMLKQIGGRRIAAPPIGAHKTAGPNLATIAERYRKLLEIGAETGVVPQLELWGFSKTLSKLGELAYVATEAGHPDACVLPDFYHIYKGGSDFAGLKMIEASRMHVFHINDYPDMPRETIGDEHRVYPGDGVCPLPEIIGDLIDSGFAGCFSLELFNRDYWKQDAAKVAATGLEKMKAVVAKA